MEIRQQFLGQTCTTQSKGRNEVRKWEWIIGRRSRPSKIPKASKPFPERPGRTDIMGNEKCIFRAGNPGHKKD